MTPEDAKRLVSRRHPEWTEFHLTWSFLQDSLEGGRRYRMADYQDGLAEGGKSNRNLIRHQRETPTVRKGNEVYDGSDRNANTTSKALEDAATSTYGLRLTRTPVPGFVAEAVDKWLSRIYRREIKREGPKPVQDWWLDVDGQGTTVDEWMTDTVAPLLTALGHVDILCDHPAAPNGEQLLTQADVNRLGLTAVRAKIVLPENMLWWRKDERGNYQECLVLEYYEADDGSTRQRYRHWTPTDSTCYDAEGRVVSPPVPHPYGRPPIRRLFDRRKFRCENTGQSRVEGIAERQREYYNADSELILSGVMTSSPILSGPADYLTSGTEITVGPGYMLPKYNSGNGNYEGWDYVTHDHKGDESLRANLDRRRDEVDRDAALTKPAGVNGSGQTSRQSGASKQLDAEDGNNLLGKLARSLAKAEKQIACLALLVASEGKVQPSDEEQIVVTYPTGFNLYSAQEQLTLIGQYQGLKMGVGQTPKADTAMLQRAVRFVLDGADDDEFVPIDDEIEQFVASQRTMLDEQAEGQGDPADDTPDPPSRSSLNPPDDESDDE